VNTILPAEETLIDREIDGQKNAHKGGTFHTLFCLLILPMNFFLCNNQNLPNQHAKIYVQFAGEIL
jgi:hypothetical protein